MGAAVLSGSSTPSGLRIAIVGTEWNRAIIDKLMVGAESFLRRGGCDEDSISRYRVPGAWELPPFVSHLCRNAEVDAVIALGCVIRGETPHFDYVAGAATRGLERVMAETGIPIGFGLLTVENLQQAEERAGGTHGNKGAEAAEAVVQLANLIAGRHEAEG